MFTESPRVIPVSEANCIAIDTTRHIHDGKDKVCDKAENFDEGKPEFSLAKTLDTKHLESQECEPKNQKVAPLRYFVTPKNKHRGNNVVLVSKDSSPNNEVIPADNEAECPVNHAIGQLQKSTTIRKYSREFTQRLHDRIRDDPNDAEPDDNGCRATFC